MTDVNKKIIELIKQNKNMKEISNILSISEKQLYVRIKQIINYGYMIKPSYCYNSNIYYNLENKNNDFDMYRTSIKMSKDDNTFRCLVISDMHIGSVDSDIKLVDIIYNYAVKNGINIIFNCGDIIENDYTTSTTNLKTVEKQLEYLVKKHPYDKTINNFLLLGNHEYHSLYNDGFDVSKLIHNSRYDIIPIGYGQANVYIKNDSIILFHKLNNDYSPVINGERILLSGHGHMMKTKMRDIFWLGIPTLSYKSNDKTKDVVPGFVDLTINIDNNRFTSAEAKHFIITSNVIQVSETRGKIKNLFRGK